MRSLPLCLIHPPIFLISSCTTNTQIHKHTNKQIHEQQTHKYSLSHPPTYLPNLIKHNKHTNTNRKSNIPPGAFCLIRSHIFIFLFKEFNIIFKYQWIISDLNPNDRWSTPSKNLNRQKRISYNNLQNKH